MSYLHLVEPPPTRSMLLPSPELLDEIERIRHVVSELERSLEILADNVDALLS